MNRKKIVYALMVVLLFNLGAPLATQAKITDVPTDHWAYYAVTNAINKGYLTVFEDNTFKGGSAVDRFTLAMVIDRLLEEIQVAQIKGTTADVAFMRELSVEFQDDLAKWYANEKTFREELQQIKENALSSEERVGRVVTAQVELEDKLSKLDQQVRTLYADLDQTQLGFAGDISASEARLEELLNAVVLLDGELSEQEEAIAGQARAIHNLENWVGEKTAVFAALQLNLESLSKDAQALKQLTQQLEEDLLGLAIKRREDGQNITKLASELEETKAGLIGTQTELTSLKEDRTYLEDLKKQFGADVSAQMNAALIREQRLERQIKELEQEFADYRTASDKEVKSAKTLATLGIALGAIGAIIGAIMGFQ